MFCKELTEYSWHHTTTSVVTAGVCLRGNCLMALRKLAIKPSRLFYRYHELILRDSRPMWRPCRNTCSVELCRTWPIHDIDDHRSLGFLGWTWLQETRHFGWLCRLLNDLGCSSPSGALIEKCSHYIHHFIIHSWPRHGQHEIS
jgi:hypothetical protein